MNDAVMVLLFVGKEFGGVTTVVSVRFVLRRRLARRLSAHDRGV